MIDLSRRRTAPEILDTASEHDAQANLADIRRLNRYFAGHAILAGQLARAGAGSGPATLLDVGGASGDHALQLRRRFPALTVTTLDLAPRNLARAPFPKVAADALRPPFGPASFDFVTCSMLLHHFDEATVVSLLANLCLIARRAVVVTDLERHWFAHGFLPATRWLFRWHPVTMHDGPVSVAAAFRSAELEELARHAGWPNPRVRRHLPWMRLSLSLVKA